MADHMLRVEDFRSKFGVFSGLLELMFSDVVFVVFLLLFRIFDVLFRPVVTHGTSPVRAGSARVERVVV